MMKKNRRMKKKATQSGWKASEDIEKKQNRKTLRKKRGRGREKGEDKT